MATFVDQDEHHKTEGKDPEAEDLRIYPDRDRGRYEGRCQPLELQDEAERGESGGLQPARLPGHALTRRQIGLPGRDIGLDRIVTSVTLISHPLSMASIFALQF